MNEYIYDVGNDLEEAGVMTFTFLESEDLIGQSEINVKEMIDDRDEEVGKWFQVDFEGEKAGIVNIICKYKPGPEPAVPDEE